VCVHINVCVCAVCLLCYFVDNLCVIHLKNVDECIDSPFILSGTSVMAFPVSIPLYM